MTALLLAAILAVSLVVSGWAGPALLRLAGPALLRSPRLSIALLSAAMVSWVGAALSLGPLLAWAGSGPALLPDGAALVCERCLQAASPFGLGTANRFLPAALLLALASAFVLLLVTAALVRARGINRRTKELAASVKAHASRARLQGTEVLLIDDERPMAFALPTRLGGIVMSTGAVRQLDADELGSVLAHEKAHLSQHHHLISQLPGALGQVFGWVPLVRALSESLEEYMEVAADEAARRHKGPRPLAAALLKLGTPPPLSAPGPGQLAVLGAAGPGRIAHLVAPRDRKVARWPVVLLVTAMAGLALAATGVVLPYASLLITGCP